MQNKIFDIPTIRGIAAVVPRNKVGIKNLTFEKDSIENIIKLSGITEIRESDVNETVSDYCLFAAKNLFEELNFDKSQIDGVIFSTPYADYIQPGSGYIVHEKLNLSNDCIVVDLKLACSGWVYGLFQAFLMIQSGWCKNVLLCVGDTPTKFINSKDKSMRSISGDAGTATIISAGTVESKSSFAFFNDGKGLKSLYIPAGGARMPRVKGVTDVEELDDQGNIRTLENLRMNGLEVMCFALDSVKKTVNSVFKEMDWQKNDVEKFFFHQANKFMVSSLAKRLKLPPEKVPFRVGNFGNSGGATIPLTLTLENDGANLPFGNYIFSGFGAGFACATAAITFKENCFCRFYEFV